MIKTPLKYAGSPIAAENKPRWVTQAEFARMIGCQRSWVSQLKKSGRLVFNRMGDRVDFPASMEKIEKTRTLSAVTEPATQARIAQAREKRDSGDSGKSESGLRVQQRASAEAQAMEAHEADTSDYSSARSRREHWNAEIAQLEYQRLVGSLIALDDALRGAAALGAAVRARVERLPDAVMPMLVESGADEAVAHRVLTDHVGELLADVSAAMKQNTQKLSDATK